MTPALHHIISSGVSTRELSKSLSSQFSDISPFSCYFHPLSSPVVRFHIIIYMAIARTNNIPSEFTSCEYYDSNTYRFPAIIKTFKLGLSVCVHVCMYACGVCTVKFNLLTYGNGTSACS